MKDDFEAAVVSATKSFQTPSLLAVIFILVGAYGDNYKIKEYKENEQLRLTCRIYAALANEPVYQ
jgi:hypothetical protein